MSKILFLLFFNSSLVFAETSPGSCGDLGCNSPNPTTTEILSVAFKSPQVIAILKESIIESVQLYSEMPLIYRITTRGSLYPIEIRIEFEEMPIAVDGVKPIAVGPAFAIITTRQIVKEEL
jgi:hypothetical protein